jgi:hypothetical protein
MADYGERDSFLKEREKVGTVLQHWLELGWGEMIWCKDLTQTTPSFFRRLFVGLLLLSNKTTNNCGIFRWPFAVSLKRDTLHFTIGRRGPYILREQCFASGLHNHVVGVPNCDSLQIWFVIYVMRQSS